MEPIGSDWPNLLRQMPGPALHGICRALGLACRGGAGSTEGFSDVRRIHRNRQPVFGRQGSDHQIVRPRHLRTSRPLFSPSGRSADIAAGAGRSQRRIEQFTPDSTFNMVGKRMPSHDFGMVGFVKYLVDEVAGGRIRPTSTAPGPTACGPCMSTSRWSSWKRPRRSRSPRRRTSGSRPPLPPCAPGPSALPGAPPRAGG
jgi:hypothetical protein